MSQNEINFSAVLLINRALTVAQRAYLSGLDCTIYGLKRVKQAYHWGVPLTGEIYLEETPRSIAPVVKAIKGIRKAGIREAVYFLDDKMLEGRENLRFFLLLAGIRLTGVSPEGHAFSMSRARAVPVFARNAFRYIAERTDPVYAPWFLAASIMARFPKKREPVEYNAVRDVLYITYGGGYGGIETVTLQMITGLDKERYRPSLLVLGKDGAMADRVRRMGVDVDIIECDRGGFRFVKRLADYFKGRKIDILHYNGTPIESRPVLLSAWIAGIEKTVFHLHGLEFFRFGRWEVDSFENIIQPRISLYLSISKDVKDLYVNRLGYPEEKIVVLNNGIDTDRFYPVRDREGAKTGYGLPVDASVICSAGRFAPEKGHESLLLALSRLKEKGVDFTCLLCGDGPLEPELRALTTTLGLDDSVRFMGARDDLPELLDAVDVFVLPSIREGLGMVLLEAMAKGVPVVASAVGGVPEIVQDGVNGFLVPPEDPDALADRLLKLLGDKTVLRVMGNKARELVEKDHSVDEFNSRLHSIYGKMA